MRGKEREISRQVDSQAEKALKEKKKNRQRRGGRRRGGGRRGQREKSQWIEEEQCSVPKSSTPTRKALEGFRYEGWLVRCIS